MNFTFLENGNLWLILLLVFWELGWKGLALWRAAQNKQRFWFIALLFINTAGILPMVYLGFFQNNKNGSVKGFI